MDDNYKDVEEQQKKQLEAWRDNIQDSSMSDQPSSSAMGQTPTPQSNRLSFMYPAIGIIIIVIVAVAVFAYMQGYFGSQTSNGSVNASCPCLNKQQLQSILSYSGAASNSSYAYTSYKLQGKNITAPNLTNAQMPLSLVPELQSINKNVTNIWNIQYPPSRHQVVGISTAAEEVFQSDYPMELYNSVDESFKKSTGNPLIGITNGFTYFYTADNETPAMVLNKATGHSQKSGYYTWDGTLVGYKDNYFVLFYVDVYSFSQIQNNTIPSIINKMAGQISSTV